MNTTTRALAGALLAAIILLLGSAQSSSAQNQTVSISEPGVMTLAQLYERADTVTIVKIVAADGESYSGNVYKSKVLKSFKGANEGDTIYFGPFAGYGLNSEYVLFLLKATQPTDPASKSSAGFGTVSVMKIFEEGYSAMAASYQCVFPGNDTKDRCDDAVRICTDYIKLPAKLHAYPPENNDPPFGCRYAREEQFLAMLTDLAKAR
jgi:hypothetical protein